MTSTPSASTDSIHWHSDPRHHLTRLPVGNFIPLDRVGVVLLSLPLLQRNYNLAIKMQPCCLYTRLLLLQRMKLSRFLVHSSFGYVVVAFEIVPLVRFLFDCCCKRLDMPWSGFNVYMKIILIVIYSPVVLDLSPNSRHSYPRLADVQLNRYVGR